MFGANPKAELIQTVRQTFKGACDDAMAARIVDKMATMMRDDELRAFLIRYCNLNGVADLPKVTPEQAFITLGRQDVCAMMVRAAGVTLDPSVYGG